jgi:ubiquinone/menaquinone biosynthesis C-methylase UbiE
MPSTQLATGNVAPLKDIQRFIWSQGDYPQIARETMAVAETLAVAVGAQAGISLLDVAAGDGNVAVAAARRGASVAAIDIAPQMVELGRQRCAAEELPVRWSEGDAEDLPFVAGSFDCVASSFGAMFAPRPGQAAAELFRVVRPGGTVGLANWTPEGFIGRLAATIASQLPQPPLQVPAPTAWGVEDVVRERLEPYAAEIIIARRTVPFVHDSVQELLGFYEACNGPLVAARALLRDRYPELRADIRRLIEDSNGAGAGRVEIDSEYLLVLARAAQARR